MWSMLGVVCSSHASVNFHYRESSSGILKFKAHEVHIKKLSLGSHEGVPTIRQPQQMGRSGGGGEGAQ